MKIELIKAFQDTYGSPASIYAEAPGRLEILGNHTDYNGGHVLSTSIDRSTAIALRKASGTTCHIKSLNFDKDFRTFERQELKNLSPSGDWSDYIKGVILEFQKRHLHIPAFEAVIDSNIPMSAGMSSSAALEMALALGLCSMIDQHLDLIELAKIGRDCENHWIGTQTGLMDQLTSLAGQEDFFVLSEYKHLSYKAFPFPKGFSLVVMDSGVKHDLRHEYNDRREQCLEALECLRQQDQSITSLCDATTEKLASVRHQLSDNAYKRAIHVVGENKRVLNAHQLLEKQDLQSFGALLFQSHKSSAQNFQNSCKELDALVEFAKRSPLCLGARLSGGGFGGISIHLVRTEQAQAYIHSAQSFFAQSVGSKIPAYLCKTAHGAFAKQL